MIKRKTQKERDAQQAADFEYCRIRGVAQGRAEAKKEFDSDQAERRLKAKVEMAKAISVMIESTARAIITFTGEGGLS